MEAGMDERTFKLENGEQGSSETQSAAKPTHKPEQKKPGKDKKETKN